MAEYDKNLENRIVTIEELKALPVGDWVWIQVWEQFEFGEKVSAYYSKHEDYTRDKSFCCGYPGLSFGFDYADYNKTWTAYKYEPKECKLK